MDKVEMACPKCSTKLKFSAKFVGRMGMCVACGTEFLIKGPNAPAEVSKKPADPIPNVVPRPTTKANFKISTYFKKPKKDS